MALVNRVARLFKADFHAVLDQIEEPEQMLRQAVRDMEDELGGTEQRIAALALEQQALDGRREELKSAIVDLDGQLDLCFKSGKDELAKKLIRKKLEAERFVKRIAANQVANGKYLEEQRKFYEENRATLESLRQKAELVAHQASARNRNHGNFDDAAWMARELTVGDEEVEIAYLREKDARSVS
ncbi:MAG TPA: PspA/IM30 family protein [Woeseiaceae bacterium]|nr:PspA/IM30 family protein [Woeseiaceae bacterium]